MKKPFVATFLVAFFVMLPRDSAICAGGGSGASGSRYTRAKVQAPIDPGEPFLLDGKIGGIEDVELQIYRQDNYPDWSRRIPCLSVLVDEALRRNPTTRQVWQTANASALNLAAARGAYWPTVTATSAAKPSYMQGPTFPGYLRTSELDYNPTLQVQYLLFDFGGREAGVDVARFNFFASEFAINQTLQTVVVGVLKSYYTLIQAEENVGIANQSFERALGIIKDIEKKATDAKNARENLKEKRKKSEKSEKSENAQGLVPVPPRIISALEEQERTNDFDKAKTTIQTTIQSLDDQKKLVEPNLSSFKLSIEIAKGALDAAKIQLLSSIGLPADLELNSKTLPTSKPPQASVFSKTDFIKKDDLIKEIIERKDKVSTFLWTNFTPDNQKKFVQAAPEEQLSIMLEEFNRVVAQRIPIYDPAQVGVKPGDETKERLRDYSNNSGNSHEAWAVNRLNRLLLEDAYPSELKKSHFLTKPPPTEKLREKVDTMIVEALRNRPDVANKYFAYRSAQASARQADSNVYPNLMGTFSGSTTSFDKTVTTDQLSGSNSGRNDNFSGALTVSIPVFDALTLVNKARAARRTAYAARADLANSELSAISDVATNFKAYESAIEQYKLAEALVFVAVDALKTAENDYTDALADYAISSENPKKDECDAELGPCVREQKRKAALKAPHDKLQTALNTLLGAQSDFASAANKWSSTKLSVFTASYQLANATGALLPGYKNAANSPNSRPVRPTDSQ